MPKPWFKAIWILTFLLLCVFLSLMPIDRSPSHTWVYIVDAGTATKVLSKEEYAIQRGMNNGSEVAFAQAIYEPEIERGPVEGLIEWSVKESVFSTKYRILPRQTILTKEQGDRAYQALIKYANADPSMIKYRPGQPPQTRFSWLLLGNTIVRLLIIAVISTLVSFGVKFLCDKEQSIRRAGKRSRGLCAWCGYPCAGLKLLRCPECGKHHTVPYLGNDSEKPEDA